MKSNVVDSRERVECLPERLVVMSCCDENFVIPLLVTLYSLATTLNPAFTVKQYIFHDGLSEGLQRTVERHLKRFGAFSEVVWMQPKQKVFDGIVPRNHVTRASRYRLVGPEFITEEGFVIYLDGDLLLRRSLHSIIADYGECQTIAAVRNFSQPYHVDRSEFGLPDWSRRMLPYFNTGIYLLNLDTWRKEKLGQLALELCEKKDARNRSITDQMILNYLFAERWTEMDPRWNQSTAIHRYEAWPDSVFKRSLSGALELLLKDPFIVHFNGFSKPWNSSCGHPMYMPYLRARLAARVDPCVKRVQLFLEYIKFTAFRGKSPLEVLRRSWRKFRSQD